MQDYIYKTELHTHTTPVSTCSEIPPEHLVEVYKKAGYTSVCVTNHFQYDGTWRVDRKIERHLEGYYKAKELGDACGLNVILGTEIRFDGPTLNDYLIFGISPEDFYAIEKLLSKDLETFYKEFKNDKNVIIQAHPYRSGVVPADPDYIDGIEVFNLHPSHNSKIGLAAKFARETGKFITAGTDFHDYGRGCLCSLLSKEPVTDTYQLADILKKRDYALEVGGYKISID